MPKSKRDFFSKLIGRISKARFKRRIFVASNAIEKKANEVTCFIIFCFNCIRCDENATFETGLRESVSFVGLVLSLRVDVIKFVLVNGEAKKLYFQYLF